MNTEKLEKNLKDFVMYATENGLQIEGIAIADEKQVLLEHRFTQDIPRDIYSHTKSYVATAVGIALEEGKLSLDDRLADYFPEYVPENPQPWLLEIRLRHLLMMASGLGTTHSLGAERRQGEGMPDYMAYMMSKTVEKEPGSRFLYSNGDSMLAGRMVEKATGMRLGAYLYDRVFAPLGQGWPVWENDPQGHPFGGSGIQMRLTEMMKLGQLYLADGIWKGQRILSREWIREASREQIRTDWEDKEWSGRYGYQFWMCPYPDAYRADGAWGQLTIVLPQKGLVVSIQCPENGDVDRMRRALQAELLELL